MQDAASEGDAEALAVVEAPSMKPINIARAVDVLGKPKAKAAPQPTVAATSRPRQDSDGMNKTEARFKREVLSVDGVWDVFYESIKLRLADRTWYTPDFAVIRLGGARMEFYEVKGSWKAPHQEDSRVKLKVAAELYPQFTFFAAVPNRDTGGWDIEEIPCRGRS